MDVRHRRDPGAGLAARLRPERPAAARWSTRADPGDSPLFNRAVQGRLRAWLDLQDLRRGAGDGAGPGQPRHAWSMPMRRCAGASHRIKEFESHNYGPLLSVDGRDRQVLERRHRAYRADDRRRCASRRS